MSRPSEPGFVLQPSPSKGLVVGALTPPAVSVLESSARWGSPNRKYQTFGTPASQHEEAAVGPQESFLIHASSSGAQMGRPPTLPQQADPQGSPKMSFSDLLAIERYNSAIMQLKNKPGDLSGSSLRRMKGRVDAGIVVKLRNMAVLRHPMEFGQLVDRFWDLALLVNGQKPLFRHGTGGAVDNMDNVVTSDLSMTKGAFLKLNMLIYGALKGQGSWSRASRRVAELDWNYYTGTESFLMPYTKFFLSMLELGDAWEISDVAGLEDTPVHILFLQSLYGPVKSSIRHYKNKTIPPYTEPVRNNKAAALVDTNRSPRKGKEPEKRIQVSMLYHEDRLTLKPHVTTIDRALTPESGRSVGAINLRKNLLTSPVPPLYKRLGVGSIVEISPRSVRLGAHSPVAPQNSMGPKRPSTTPRTAREPSPTKSAIAPTRPKFVSVATIPHQKECTHPFAATATANMSPGAGVPPDHFRHLPYKDKCHLEDLIVNRERAAMEDTLYGPGSEDRFRPLNLTEPHKFPSWKKVLDMVNRDQTQVSQDVDKTELMKRLNRPLEDGSNVTERVQKVMNKTIHGHVQERMWKEITSDFLHNETPTIVVASLRALQRCGIKANPLAKPIVPLLADKNVNIRSAAQECLAAIGVVDTKIEDGKFLRTTRVGIPSKVDNDKEKLVLSGLPRTVKTDDRPANEVGMDGQIKGKSEEEAFVMPAASRSFRLPRRPKTAPLSTKRKLPPRWREVSGPGGVLSIDPTRSIQGSSLDTSLKDVMMQRRNSFVSEPKASRSNTVDGMGSRAGSRLDENPEEDDVFGELPQQSRRSTVQTTFRGRHSLTADGHSLKLKEIVGKAGGVTGIPRSPLPARRPQDIAHTLEPIRGESHDGTPTEF